MEKKIKEYRVWLNLEELFPLLIAFRNKNVENISHISSRIHFQNISYVFTPTHPHSHTHLDTHTHALSRTNTYPYFTHARTRILKCGHTHTPSHTKEQFRSSQITNSDIKWVTDWNAKHRGKKDKLRFTDSRPIQLKCQNVRSHLERSISNEINTLTLFQEISINSIHDTGEG